MSERGWKGMAATGARALVGVVVAAAGVAGLAAAVLVPWPSMTATAPEISVSPAAGTAVRSCAGSVLALGRTAAQAQQISVAGPVALFSAGTVAAGTLKGVEVSSAPAKTFTTPARGSEPGEGAAAGSARIAADDMSGFAAFSCTEASMESWIVGGNTSTGVSGILTLANPAEVPASVTITVYGAAGAKQQPALVVPAGSQRALALAGIAGGERAPVLRISSQGAPVAASLQSSTVFTLAPGGLDVQTAVPAATASLAVPGIYSDGVAESGLVRLLSPTDDTEVTLSLVASGTGVVTALERARLTAGVPAQFELGRLEAGTYTLLAEAGAPLVGAVWSTTGHGGGNDDVWNVSAPVLSRPALVAVPAGPAPGITIVNRGSAPATVTLAPRAGGAAQTLQIAAGQAVTQNVAQNSAWRIDPGSAQVSAAVTFHAARERGSFPVADPGAQSGAVRVFP